MQYKNEFKNNEAVVFADTTLFSKDSIFKCLYWYGDKFHTNVSFADDKTYKVSIKPISTVQLDEVELEKLLLKLEKQNESLNDYAHMVSHDLKSPLNWYRRKHSVNC